MSIPWLWGEYERLQILQKPSLKEQGVLDGIRKQQADLLQEGIDKIIESLIKSYPILSWLEKEHKAQMMKYMMEWEKEKMRDILLHYHSKVQDRDEKRLSIKERAKEYMIDEYDNQKQLPRGMTVINDIMEIVWYKYLITDKESFRAKTLFQKIGLSPTILTKENIVSHYIVDGYRYEGITVSLQYFLAWLYGDRKTFGELENDYRFDMPYREGDNIHTVSYVNAIAWEHKLLATLNVADIQQQHTTTHTMHHEKTHMSIEQAHYIIDKMGDIITTAHYQNCKKFYGDEKWPSSLAAVMHPLIQKAWWYTMIKKLQYYRAILRNDKKLQENIEHAEKKQITASSQWWGKYYRSPDI